MRHRGRAAGWLWARVCPVLETVGARRLDNHESHAKAESPCRPHCVGVRPAASGTGRWTRRGYRGSWPQ
jgi:hypothetical protein